MGWPLRTPARPDCTIFAEISRPPHPFTFATSMPSPHAVNYEVRSRQPSIRRLAMDMFDRKVGASSW